jgi:Carboxypeptidase regulatory-like domain
LRQLVLTLLSSLFLLPAISPAQSPAQLPDDSKATIVRGVVTDPSSALVPQAQVVLHPASPNNPEQNILTTPEGRYAFANVAPGAYTLRVTAAGFAPFESKPFNLAAGKPQDLNIHLLIETQQFQMNVTSNNTDDTDPNKNGDAIVLTGKAIDNLPTEPSQLQQQLQAMSGGDAPAMYVDGFSNGTLPPKDTIREIRINQNPYSARNDTDAMNGMIEIFTKPGSDKLHADLFIIGNASGLNTQNPFTQGQPPYHSTQLDGDINGPLTKKSSYFLNVDRRSAQTNAVVNAEVLDPTNTTQINFTQALPSPNTSTQFSPRVDLQLGAKSTISLRYSFTSAQQTNGGIGQFNLASQGFNSTTTTQLLQASNSQVFSSKIVNDTRFQYIRTRTAQTPQSTTPTLLVEGAFTGGGNNLGASHDNTDSYELQNYIAIQAGKHYFSPGVRLRVNRDANVSRAGYNGEFLFSTLAAYQTAAQALAQCTLTQPASQCNIAGASQFSLTTGTPSATIDVVDLGAFFQDDWKILPHLTLSYGLRYEIQNYISDKGDFAPRFGFSWGLGVKKDKPARFVLRGGSGVFYTRLASSNILQAQRENGISQQQFIVASPATYPNFPTLGAQNSPTIYRISPSYRSPYAIQNNIALDHPLGSRGTLSVNYFYNRGVHALLTRNINAPLPGTYNPADPASGVRPYGGTQNIDEYESVGVYRTNRISANLQFQAKNEFSVYSWYQLRFRESDASGGFPSNGYNIRADYGRTATDVRQNLSLFVNSPLLPGRIHVGSYIQASSGTPFNIVVGQDLNGDSQFNDRPAFATDLTRPSVIATRFGNFDTSPIAGQTIIPINYGQGPGLFAMGAQLLREFTFGPVIPPDPNAPKPAAAAPPPKGKPYTPRKYNLILAAEAENIINHVNLAPPVGTLGSPLFGHSTALAGSSGEANANRVINLILFTRF